jgi:chloramphenicol-sensitive protein RarD
MQFLLGVLVFHEELGVIKLLGFALVWVALCAFTVDLARNTRRTRGSAAVAVPEPV